MSIAPGCDLTREEDVAMVGGNVDVGLGQEIIERERERKEVRGPNYPMVEMG